jgi:hypothetical protein
MAAPLRESIYTCQSIVVHVTRVKTELPAQVKLPASKKNKRWIYGDAPYRITSTKSNHIAQSGINFSPMTANSRKMDLSAKIQFSD